MNRKYLCIIVMLVMILVGCTDKIKKTDREIQKKVIVNLKRDPKELSSIFADTDEAAVVIGHIFEGLTRLDKNQNIQPGVAKNWYISEDKLTYTFYLRSGRWSDGSQITAMDFEFGLKEVLNPKNYSKCAYKLYPIKNARAYNLYGGLRDDVGVIAKNDSILEITLERPCPYLLHLLAGHTCMPIKKEFYDNQREEYAKTELNMIFNGPWILDEWKHDDKIVLRKNVYYWNMNNIKLDEIDFLMINDDKVLFNMFKEHNLDVLDVRGDYLSALYMDGYKIKKRLDGSTVCLEFNLNNEFLQSKNLRKAITYVIDREELSDLVWNKENIQARLLTNPVVKYASNLNAIKFRPSKQQCIIIAKELFNNELYQMGRNGDIRINFLTEDDKFLLKEAHYIKECIEKNLGITVDIECLPLEDKLNRHKRGEFDMVIMSVSPNRNSPLAYLEKFGGSNSLTYHNPEYDALLDEGLFYTNKRDSIDIFDKMETLLADDVPIYPLYYRQINYVVQHNLKGVIRGAFKNIDLYYVHY